MPVAAILTLIGLNIAWGLSFIIVKDLLQYFPPFFLATWKFIIIALYGVIIKHRQQLSWSELIPRALLGTVLYHLAKYSALDTAIDSGTAILVAQLAIPLTSLFTWLFNNEEINLAQIFGIVLIFAGVVSIYGTPVIQNDLTGFAILITMALLMALHNLLIKTLDEKKLKNIVISECYFAAPIMLMLCYTSAELDYKMADIPDNAWLMLIFSTLLISLYSNQLWYGLLNRYSAHRVVSFSIISPVTGFIAAALLEDAEFTEFHYFGVVIIILGIYIINVVTKSRSRDNKEFGYHN